MDFLAIRPVRRAARAQSTVFETAAPFDNPAAWKGARIEHAAPQFHAALSLSKRAFPYDAAHPSLGRRLFARASTAIVWTGQGNHGNNPVSIIAISII